MTKDKLYEFFKKFEEDSALPILDNVDEITDVPALTKIEDTSVEVPNTIEQPTDKPVEKSVEEPIVKEPVEKPTKPIDSYTIDNIGTVTNKGLANILSKNRDKGDIIDNSVYEAKNPSDAHKVTEQEESAITQLTAKYVQNLLNGIGIDRENPDEVEEELIESAGEGWEESIQKESEYIAREILTNPGHDGYIVSRHDSDSSKTTNSQNGNIGMGNTLKLGSVKIMY